MDIQHLRIKLFRAGEKVPIATSLNEALNKPILDFSEHASVQKRFAPRFKNNRLARPIFATHPRVAAVSDLSEVP